MPEAEGGAGVAEAAPETGAAEGGAQDQEEQLGKDSYSKEEVSKLISERVNKLNGKYTGWAELEKMGLKPDQIKQALAQRKAAPQAAPKDAAAELTPQDKEAQTYLKKIFPGLESVGEVRQAMQFVLQARAEQITRSNTETLRGLVKEAGLPDASFDRLNDLVADSIKANKEDLSAYQRTGDMNIVKKHFEEVKKFLSTISLKANAEMAQGKAKTLGLPPRLPQGGVPAPTSSSKPMSTKETLDAAFAALNGK